MPRTRTAPHPFDQLASRLADVIAARIQATLPAPGRAKSGNGRRAGRGKGRKLDMSCRVDGCRNRSRGPRFHFLCAEHGKKLSAREKKAVAEAYKAKRK